MLYNRSMINKRDKLTPGNVRMIGVPVALHERLKAEAKREHATIYEVIEDALQARERLAVITAAINPQAAQHEAA